MGNIFSRPEPERFVPVYIETVPERESAPSPVPERESAPETDVYVAEPEITFGSD
jgi:hypothetical protein